MIVPILKPGSYSCIQRNYLHYSEFNPARVKVVERLTGGRSRIYFKGSTKTLYVAENHRYLRRRIKEEIERAAA